MDELLADFLTETTEHIEGIESFLVLFEQNPSDADAVTQIFRLLHTIKGTCSFLGLERLRVIAHAAETLVDTLRNGAPPTATAVSLLLRAMDRIKQLVAAVKQSEEEPKGDDLDICNKIEAYLRGETGSEASETPQDSPQQEAERPEPDEPEPAQAEPAQTEEAQAEPPQAEAPKDRRKAKQAKQPKEIGRVAVRSGPVPVPAAAGATMPQSVPATAAPPAKDEEEEPSKEAGQLAKDPKEIKEAETSPAAKEKASDSIRITVGAIQRIMDLVSELVLTRNQIMELSRHGDISKVKAPLERLSTVTSDLQDAVMQARMQPMSRLFASVPRLVRELSIELKKKYNLIIDGAETELDRQLIEAIRDPLTHLIRNCADHGIESPEDRKAAGKPEAGEISIAAYYESGQVHIEVADDGRGLDADRIRQKAIERGLGSHATIEQMSDEEVFRFILQAGFSTATKVTSVSGRGVGMDVVRSNLKSIGGTIGIESAKGKGSKFILKIPLTLAIAPALIVKVSGQQFAIPQQSVVEAVSIDEASARLQTVQNALVLQLRDEIIPIAELSAILELSSSTVQTEKQIIVLAFRGRKFGIIIDDIAGIQEIVVQPLGHVFHGLKLFSGNTILGDGSIVLIIDTAGIANSMSLQMNSEALLTQAKETHEIGTTSSLILFKSGFGAQKVLPRSTVSRILRVKKSEVNEADGAYVYLYQQKLIPIVKVADGGMQTDYCLILIVTITGKTFGLWVDEVVDIIESTSEIQLAKSSISVIGTLDLRRRCGRVHRHRLLLSPRLRRGRGRYPPGWTAYFRWRAWHAGHADAGAGFGLPQSDHRGQRRAGECPSAIFELQRRHYGFEGTQPARPFSAGASGPSVLRNPRRRGRGACGRRGRRTERRYLQVRPAAPSQHHRRTSCRASRGSLPPCRQSAAG